jgi:hypothetical protein
MTEKREKSFVANAPLDDKEEWTKNYDAKKNKASSHFKQNIFTLKGKPLKALPNASQWPPPREGGTCVASGCS